MARHNDVIQRYEVRLLAGMLATLLSLLLALVSTALMIDRDGGIRLIGVVILCVFVLLGIALVMLLRSIHSN